MSAATENAPAADATPNKDGATTAITMRKLSMKGKLILIFISLVMMSVLRTGFVFFIIGMLPCIVAFYMDVSKHRYLFKSVFAANLSGIMPYLAKILENGPSSMILQEIMGDSTSWIIIYGSAAIGFALVKTCPMFAQTLVEKMNQIQLARYEALQKKLEDEWGPEVAQFSGDNAQPQD